MQELSNIISNRNVVAITIIQPMRPVAGHSAAVFPAIYAAEKSGDPGRYCISKVGDGNVCVIDSVQSQAGRIEAAFQTAPYRALTRTMAVKIETKEGERTVDVLAAGHRVFDAVFRFSTLSDAITTASEAYNKGDARPMAELSPMSLVCGAWDSRGSKLQIPRALSSEIIARDVDVLSRGAAYRASVRASEVEGLDELGSVEGLDHALNFGVGGVVAKSIERRVVVSLATLRRNARAGIEPNDTLNYLFALSMVAATMPVDPDLRSGCMVLPDGVAKVELQMIDGSTQAVELTHDAALGYAAAAAASLGVPGLPELVGRFEPARTKPVDAKPAKAGKKDKAATAGAA